VGPRAGLDGCGKSRSPPGFDPRTIQPVASRYNDYAIPAAVPPSRGRESMNVQNGYDQLVRSRGIHTQVDVIVADQRVPGSICVGLTGANKFAW